MSRLTFSSNLRVLDENSVVAKFRGKEDAAFTVKQPGMKKKALADVANTLNQKAAESLTPKKVGIHLPLKKGQFNVFEKSVKKLDKTSPNENSKLLLQSTKKKLHVKEKLILGKDIVKQISEKPTKDVEKLGKARDSELSEKKDYEKVKPVDVAIVVHVDDEDEKEPVEEFGCSHCSQPVEDDYDDILPIRLTPQQIIDSAMCWEPKPPTVMEKKILNLPFLPEPEIYDTEDDIFELDGISLTI